MDSFTIEKTLEKVDRHEILLPSIQRKFVWSEDKIIRLFDSIMRDYPFGTFLFWHIEGKETKEYRFYEFIKNYSWRDQMINQKAEPNDKIDVVMDGQQRLTALYIGIYGSLETKAKWAKNKAENWKKKYLYFQPNTEERTDDDMPYRFAFMTEADAENWNSKKEERYKYYRVNDFRNMEKPALREKLQVGQIRCQNEDWKFNLEKLRSRINDEKLIPIHTIEKRNLSDVLEIFTRINNGGTPLSRSNLLFSTVITTWEKGREEMDYFISSFNKDDVIILKEDFLIRVCLYLLNCRMSSTIAMLKKSDVEQIKLHWEAIKTAMGRVKQYLSDHHLMHEAIISYNALLPIAYYFYHSKKSGASKKSEEQLLNYFSVSQLFSLFGGSNDAGLEKIRRAMCQDGELGNLKEPFTLDSLYEVSLTAGRSHAFKKTRADIEELVDTVSYGDKKSYALLSFLQPEVSLHKRMGNYYDVDHVCSRKELKELYRGTWSTNADRIAIESKVNLISNLQLLDESINRGDKKDKPLYRWAIEEKQEQRIPFNPFKDDGDPEKYRIDSREKFEAFYNARRELIIQYLCDKLGIEK